MRLLLVNFIGFLTSLLSPLADALTFDLLQHFLLFSVASHKRLKMRTTFCSRLDETRDVLVSTSIEAVGILWITLHLCVLNFFSAVRLTSIGHDAPYPSGLITSVKSQLPVHGKAIFYSSLAIRERSVSQQLGTSSLSVVVRSSKFQISDTHTQIHIWT